MFDTHCHLNFSRFKKNVEEVIQRAKEAGITNIVIPGTDVESSQKAIEIAEKHEGIYAAIGIHPHHAYEYSSRHSERIRQLAEKSKNLTPPNVKWNEILRSAQDDIAQLTKLISYPKVVAVGEIGLDKHVYKETKYEEYNVTPEFLTQQKELLTQQLQLAIKHKKSVILHNREATEDLVNLLTQHWDKHFEGRSVFHCCEPNRKLLEFAKEHKIFLGVDGDITYEKEKQEFIKEIPLELLVVETDSPFLLPEPMRSRREFPNEPKNIPFIISFIANILGKDEEELQKITTENGKRLFTIN